MTASDLEAHSRSPHNPAILGTAGILPAFFSHRREDIRSASTISEQCNSLHKPDFMDFNVIKTCHLAP